MLRPRLAISCFAVFLLVPPVSAQNEAVSVSLRSDPAVQTKEIVDPRARAVQLNEQGVELVFQGQQALGLKKIQQALELDPRNTTIRYNMAGLYLAIGEPEKAARMMEKVVALDPDDPAFQNRLAESYTGEKDFDSAVKVYQRLAKRAENRGEILLKVGSLQGMMGEYQSAEETLKSAKEILGETPPLLNNLGSVLLVQGKHSEAVPLLKAAQDKAPSADTALSLGIAYEASGELVRAKSWYEKARTLGAEGTDLDERIADIESQLTSNQR